MKTKLLTALVAGMTLACAAHAEGLSDYVHLEFGVGESFFQTQGDGTWYQSHFPHELDLNFPAIEVGLTGPVVQYEHWGVDWHLSYAYLGRVSVNAEATPSDQNYSRTSPTGCNGQCWPLARYVGNGNLNGVYFSLAPHYDIGPWKLAVEAGPFVYRPTWRETVYNWVSSPEADPQTLHVRNNPAWRVGAMVGASVSYGRFSVAYQYFFDKSPITSSDPYPPVWKGTHVLMVQYTADIF